jgi:hemerythrin
LFKLIESGSEDIDAQHMQLIECMNELHQAMHANPPDKAVLNRAFKRLQYYALSHFAYEENGMSLFNYRYANEHKMQHLYFKNRLNEIELQPEAESFFVATELLLFLREWLIEHIAKSDAEYAAFLRERLKSAS